MTQSIFLLPSWIGRNVQVVVQKKASPSTKFLSVVLRIHIILSESDTRNGNVKGTRHPEIKPLPFCKPYYEFLTNEEMLCRLLLPFQCPSSYGVFCVLASATSRNHRVT